MSFHSKNKLIFIDSLKVLSSLVDNLVKNVDKDNFKDLS